ARRPESSRFQFHLLRGGRRPRVGHRSRSEALLPSRWDRGGNKPSCGGNGLRLGLRGLWDSIGTGLPEGCCPRVSRSHLVPPFPSAPPVRVGRYPTRRGVSPHPRKGRRGQVEDPQALRYSAGQSTPGSALRSAGGRETTRTSRSRTGSPPCFGVSILHHISGRFVTCETDPARRRERLGRPPGRRAAGGALPEATKRGGVGGIGNETGERSWSWSAVGGAGALR